MWSSCEGPAFCLWTSCVLYVFSTFSFTVYRSVCHSVFCSGTSICLWNQYAHGSSYCRVTCDTDILVIVLFLQYLASSRSVTFSVQVGLHFFCFFSCILSSFANVIAFLFSVSKRWCGVTWMRCVDALDASHVREIIFNVNFQNKSSSTYFNENVLAHCR